jgi:hypothetical protein
LVVARGVDGELVEEFAGAGVDDADVEVVDEQDDVGSAVGSADADVSELAGHAQGHGAGLVYDVVPDPVVGVGVAAGTGQGLGHGVVERCRCRPVRQRERCGRCWLYSATKRSSRACAVGAGEPVVGEVGLPGLVRHRGLEPDVGRLRLLLRLRDDRAVRVRIRWMVARDRAVPWCWARCQPRVSAPASCPSSRSCLCRRRTSSTVSGGVAPGEVLGRRDRGSNAAWPRPGSGP